MKPQSPEEAGAASAFWLPPAILMEASFSSVASRKACRSGLSTSPGWATTRRRNFSSSRRRYSRSSGLNLSGRKG